MSLLAWYKLDGDANDSGPNGFHGTAYGVSWFLSGKTHQNTARLSGTTSKILIPHNDLLSSRVFGISETFSFSVWVYIEAWNDYGVIVNKASAGEFSNSTASIWVYSGGLGFVLGANVAGNPTDSYQRIVIDDAAITTNKWHHVVAKCDDEYMYLYIDGELSQDIVVGANPLAISSGLTNYPRSENTNDITIGPRTDQTDNSNFIGRINDLRIYDHALSVKEIKELAKAPILHYKFDINKETSYNYYPNSTDLYAFEKTKSPSNCILSEETSFSSPVGDSPMKMYATAADPKTGGAQGFYIEIDTTGQTWTFSSYYKGDVDCDDYSGGNIILIEFSGTTLKRSKGKSISFSNEWKRESVSITTEYSGDGVYLQHRLDGPESTTGSTVWFDGVQVEKKDHYTNLIPTYGSGTTRIDIIPDDTGNGNNATLNQFSPQFLTGFTNIGYGCYKFSGETYIEMSEDTWTYLSEFSVSLWFYVKEYLSTNRMLINKFFSTGRGLGIFLRGPTNNIEVYDDSLGNDLYINSTPYDINKWNHVVMTVDSNLLCSLYLNGSLQSATTVEASWDYFEGSIYLGQRGNGSYYLGQNLDAYMKDVRIYATPLSATTVLSLYKERYSIDNIGNFYAHRIEEEEMEETNRRGAETDMFCVGTSLWISALYDETEINVYNPFSGLTQTISLSAQTATGITVSVGDIIYSTKPVFKGGVGGAMGVPFGWSGKKFAFRVDRGSPNLVYIFSRDPKSNVKIFRDDYPWLALQTYEILKNQYEIYSAVSTYDYMIESDGLICVYISGTLDRRPVYPAVKELYGVPSGNFDIVGTEDGTFLKLTRSNGDITGVTLGRCESLNNVYGTGQHFNGDSYKIEASKPIGVFAQADGDGSEAVPISDSDSFGTHFVLPDDAEFVVFVGDVTGATIDMYSGATLVDSYTVEGVGPTKLKITGVTTASFTGVTAEMLFICSSPQYSVYEDFDTNDETIFFGCNPNYTGATINRYLMNSSGRTMYNIEEDILDDLIGWWKLDGDADDSTKYRLHGTISGVTASDGLGQVCMNFSGFSQYILIPSDTIFNLIQDISISVWMYKYGYNDNVNGSIFANGGGYTDYGFSLMALNSGLTQRSGNTRFEFQGENHKHATDIEVPFDEWHHVVGTYNSRTGEVVTYLDGVLSATTIFNGPIGINTNDLMIGYANYASYGGSFYNGKLQDIRLYNRVLSEQEIKIIYNITNPEQKQRFIHLSDEIFLKGNLSEE